MRFSDFAENQKSLSASELKHNFGNGFLLILDRDTPVWGDPSVESTFITTPEASAMARVAQANLVQSRMHQLAAPGHRPSMISIGRVVRSAVQIDRATVSKFHAYFVYDPASDSFSLADGGSSNGTWIDDTRLQVDEPVPLDGGESIRFSPTVHATFHTAKTLRYAIQMVLNPPVGMMSAAGAQK